jgi:hypothetical protein
VLQGVLDTTEVNEADDEGAVCVCGGGGGAIGPPEVAVRPSASVSWTVRPPASVLGVVRPSGSTVWLPAVASGGNPSGT